MPTKETYLTIRQKMLLAAGLLTPLAAAAYRLKNKASLVHARHMEIQGQGASYPTIEEYETPPARKPEHPGPERAQTGKGLAVQQEMAGRQGTPARNRKAVGENITTPAHATDGVHETPPVRTSVGEDERFSSAAMLPEKKRRKFWHIPSGSKEEFPAGRHEGGELARSHGGGKHGHALSDDARSILFHPFYP